MDSLEAEVGNSFLQREFTFATFEVGDTTGLGHCSWVLGGPRLEPELLIELLELVAGKRLSLMCGADVSFGSQTNTSYILELTFYHSGCSSSLFIY